MENRCILKKKSLLQKSPQSYLKGLRGFLRAAENRVVRLDWLKREPLISIKKEPGTRYASRLNLVAEREGFEPSVPL